jgi:two-component system response regulator DctR
MPKRNVLIVEDDPVVARFHQQVVADMPGFRVIGIATSGAEALRQVEDMKPDLLLLDLGIPQGNGLSLLRRIRTDRIPVEVIAVTAASETETIRDTLHLGVVDYLVKPFEPERLRQALSQFAYRMATLDQPRLRQDAVDVLRMTAAPKKRWVPKDLRPERLKLVREALGEGEGPLTAEEVGAQAKIARVTARRYLEYMVTIGQARTWSVPNGAGRPRKVYEIDSANRVDSEAIRQI